MSANHNKEQQKPKDKVFTRRLDFYWQSISIYSVILIIYVLLSGTFSSGKMQVVLYDPIVILLALFVIGSSFALMINAYKKRIIIIGKDFIIFKSRYKEKKYSINEILKISMGKEKMLKIRGAYRVIKIKINNRKRIIRIRPSSYWEEEQLVRMLAGFKTGFSK